MMQMEMWQGQPQDFPSAIVLARLADVVLNNNVMYRMVQPTEQGTEVVSVNRMVNVVPFRRIYRFDRKEELNEFCNELLRRPLVLHPVVHLGRGLGSGNLACGLCYKDDKWVMMVNQTHPKILGRLQIGLDTARNAMARGQSYEIRFAFSKVVEKLYKETLSQSEQENAAKTLDLIKSYFRYAEWEYGDLILRYHGYAARFGRGGGLRDMNTLNLTFMFEDLLDQEISWKTLGAEFFPKPHLAPITEDEIRECLPAWTVNGVSPLENIGEKAPAANYSYSQAGRLYESFRKKKRRPRAEMADQAEGGMPPRPTVTDGIELKVMGHEDRDQWQQQSQVDDGYGEEPPDGHHRYGQNRFDSRVNHSREGYQHTAQQWQGEYAEEDKPYEGKGAKPKRGQQYDTYGHMYPEVKVNTSNARKPNDNRHRSNGPLPYPNSNADIPTTNPRTNTHQGHSPSPYANGPQKGQTTNLYARPSPSQDEHEYSPLRDQFTRLHMQGSDRSSHSEAGSGAADSGICSDSDGHMREGSYDKPFPSVQKNIPAHPYALDNHGFHNDESDVSDALRKHKELVAKMMGGVQSQAAETDRMQPTSGYGSNQQQRYRSHISDKDYGGYVDRNGAVPPRVKSDIPSPISLKGQQYDYTSGSNAHYSYRNSSSPSAHSPKLPVEESFI